MLTKVDLPDHSRSIMPTDPDQYPIAWSGLIELIWSAVGAQLKPEANFLHNASKTLSSRRVLLNLKEKNSARENQLIERQITVLIDYETLF